MPRSLLPIAAAVMAATLWRAATAADLANPYDAIPHCPDARMALQQQAPPLRAPVAPDGPFEVEAGPYSYDSEGNLELKGENGGKVVLTQGDNHLSVDSVSFNAARNQAQMKGEITYQNPGLTVRGKGGELTREQASIENAQFELPLQPARGAAERLSITTAGVLRLQAVSYTTCPEGDADWQVRAGSISLDTQRQIGVARNARVEFMGLTLLKLPVLSFPIGSARKSGFLFPVPGSSSRGGLQFSTPYYINLAPNYDLTITPTVFVKRGLDVETELRYLTTRSRGDFTANLLPNDQNFGQTRNRIGLRNVTELAGDWRLSIDATNVSDAQYFEDFSSGGDGSNIAFVPRRLELRYRDNVWDTGVLLRNYQTVDQALTATDKPYTEIPRLYARGSWSTDTRIPMEYGFSSEATLFQRNAGVDGDSTPLHRLHSTSQEQDIFCALPWRWKQPATNCQAQAARLADHCHAHYPP
jgi:LPS-assembly protein